MYKPVKTCKLASEANFISKKGECDPDILAFLFTPAFKLIRNHY